MDTDVFQTFRKQAILKTEKDFLKKNSKNGKNRFFSKHKLLLVEIVDLGKSKSGVRIPCIRLLKYCIVFETIG